MAFNVDNYTSTKVMINSRERTSGSIENFLYNMNAVPLRELSGFAITQVCMPKSYYVVNDSTNTLIIEESLSGNHTITMPNGNYTVSNIAAAFATAINASGVVNTYGVTYDSITGKLTVTRTAGVQTFRFVSGSLIAIVGQFGGGFATSQLATNPVSLNGPLELFVCSSKLSACSVENEQSIENHSTSSIIQKVPMGLNEQVSPYGYPIINYEPNILTIQRILTSKITAVDLSLKFSSSFQNSDVDLNGENWSITIVFYQKKF